MRLTTIAPAILLLEPTPAPPAGSTMPPLESTSAAPPARRRIQARDSSDPLQSAALVAAIDASSGVISIALNAAEGFGNEAGNVRLRFQTAHVSLQEAQVALQLAVAWGYIGEQQTTAVLSALDAVGGRLFGLSRR